MAASDKAFVDAQNASRRGRLNEEAAERQEDRQQVLDERQDTLFNRSTTLFEQQQKFLADEREQQKFGRDANTAIAMFKATGGQVYQPVLDLYKRIPDGGKFHEFVRNDDGTFKFDVEWQGQRYRTDKATFDEVGKMVMSIGNPAQYLADSGAAAAAEAEFNQQKELARIKAAGRQKEETLKFFDGKMTSKQYYDGRKQFSDEYNDIMSNDPEALMTPDASAEGGQRRIGIEEYIAGKFLTMGIDISGLQAQPDGSLRDMTPPDPTTTSFRDMQKYLIDAKLADDVTAVDATIDAFIDLGRADELEGLFSGNDKASKKRRARIKAAKEAKAAGSAEEAAAKDAAAAAIIVNEGAVDEPVVSESGAIPDKGPQINPRTGKPYPKKDEAPVNKFFRTKVAPAARGVFEAIDEKNKATSGKGS